MNPAGSECPEKESSKRGDGYLRMLLIHGARSALLAARRKLASDGDFTRLQRWTVTLNERAHHNTTAVSLANKMACTIWADWTRDEDYRG